MIQGRNKKHVGTAYYQKNIYNIEFNICTPQSISITQHSGVGRQEDDISHDWVSAPYPRSFERSKDPIAKQLSNTFLKKFVVFLPF